MGIQENQALTNVDTKLESKLLPEKQIAVNDQNAGVIQRVLCLSDGTVCNLTGLTCSGDIREWQLYFVEFIKSQKCRFTNVAKALKAFQSQL